MDKYVHKLVHGKDMRMEYIAIYGVKSKTRIKLTIEEYEKLTNLFNGLEPLCKTDTFIYFELEGDYSNELKT